MLCMLLSDTLFSLTFSSTAWSYCSHFLWIKLDTSALMVIFFCHPDKNLNILVKRRALFKDYFKQIDMWDPLWGIFLITGWYRKAQPNIMVPLLEQWASAVYSSWASQRKGRQKCCRLVWGCCVFKCSLLAAKIWLPSTRKSSPIYTKCTTYCLNVGTGQKKQKVYIKWFSQGM